MAKKDKNVYMRAPNGMVFQTRYPESHTDSVKVTNKEGKTAIREQARAKLRELLAPKTEICCILRSVSRSGMNRSIATVIAHDGEVHDITHLVAEALEKNVDAHNGIPMGGCGMDMGFALVYNLGMALWPNGTSEPHGMRNGKPDSSGGYALKHRWL